MNAYLKGHLTGVTPLCELIDALDIIMLKQGQRVSSQNYGYAMNKPSLRTASPAEVTAWAHLTHYAATLVAKELQQMSAYRAEDVTEVRRLAGSTPTADSDSSSSLSPRTEVSVIVMPFKPRRSRSSNGSENAVQNAELTS